jgi:hypothetical protein
MPTRAFGTSALLPQPNLTPRYKPQRTIPWIWHLIGRRWVRADRDSAQIPGTRGGGPGAAANRARKGRKRKISGAASECERWRRRSGWEKKRRVGRPRKGKRQMREGEGGVGPRLGSALRGRRAFSWRSGSGTQRVPAWRASEWSGVRGSENRDHTPASDSIFACEKSLTPHFSHFGKLK